MSTIGKSFSPNKQDTYHLISSASEHSSAKVKADADKVVYDQDTLKSDLLSGASATTIAYDESQLRKDEQSFWSDYKSDIQSNSSWLKSTGAPQSAITQAQGWLNGAVGQLNKFANDPNYTTEGETTGSTSSTGSPSSATGAPATTGGSDQALIDWLNQSGNSGTTASVPSFLQSILQNGPGHYTDNTGSPCLQQDLDHNQWVDLVRYAHSLSGPAEQALVSELDLYPAHSGPSGTVKWGDNLAEAVSNYDSTGKSKSALYYPPFTGLPSDVVGILDAGSAAYGDSNKVEWSLNPTQWGKLVQDAASLSPQDQATLESALQWYPVNGSTGESGTTGTITWSSALTDAISNYNAAGGGNNGMAQAIGDYPVFAPIKDAMQGQPTQWRWDAFCQIMAGNPTVDHDENQIFGDLFSVYATLKNSGQTEALDAMRSALATGSTAAGSTFSFYHNGTTLDGADMFTKLGNAYDDLMKDMNGNDSFNNYGQITVYPDDGTPNQWDVGYWGYGWFQHEKDPGWSKADTHKS